MASFHELLLAAGRRSRQVVTGELGGGTTTQLATDLPDIKPDAALFDSAWLMLDDGTTRGINGYSPSTGDITLSGALANAPDPGDAFVIFGLAPPYPVAGAGTTWADALNEGLDYCYEEHTFELEPADDDADALTREFAVPEDEMGGVEPSAWPRIASRAEVHDSNVDHRQNLRRNGYRWRIENGRFIVNKPLFLTDDRTLTLTITRPHRSDYTFATRTNEVEIERGRAVSACLWRFHHMLNTTLGDGKYAGAAGAFREEFKRYERRYKPRATVSY